MAPWDEPSSRTCYVSNMELLQMEKEKVANKTIEEMMNRIKELFLAKELALENEEVIEGQTYEESYQENLDEFSHVEYLDDTFDKDEVLIFALPLDEDIHTSTHPLHKDKVMIIFGQADGLVIAQFVLVQKGSAKGGQIGVTRGCPITVTLIRHLFLFRGEIPGEMYPVT
jgi:hypothetical protein